MSNTHCKLDAASAEYIRYLRSTKAKSPLTIDKEEQTLGGWCVAYGQTPIKKLSLDDIREYASSRAEAGSSNRTINLDVLALKNLLVWFRDAGRLADPLATENWKRLKHTTPKRNLIPADTVERFCAEALRCDADGMMIYQSGQFIADYVKLLAYSGCRRTAGLKAKWSNVNWESKQISFDTKFDKRVTVDMNAKLEEHLRWMKSRHASESDFLFPGGLYETPVSPHRLFDQVKKAAGLGDVCFHDFRHQFISKAIMAGIDTLTVARWAGHADGGVLIGRVYGHLNNSHLQAAAAKLTL